MLTCANLNSAQLAAPTASEPGSQLTISLVTMGPGEEVYEKFGHNAILVEDSSATESVWKALTFNYGSFEFDSGFIGRFVRGDLDYWVEAHPYDEELKYYRGCNRSIWVQRLNLTPRQRLELRDFLVWNCFGTHADGTPAKYYRYDYYRDNCSTRVRDALDRVLGGQLQRQFSAIKTDTTYRFHTRRSMVSNFPVYTSLQFVLGQNVDRPLSAWEECFLPMRLRDYLREVDVPDETGQLRPLVSGERTLFESTRPAVPQSPPFWLPWYLLIGLAVAGGLSWLPRYAPQRRLARLGWALLAALWAFLLGGAGTFLAWVTCFTSHVSVYRNENLFHFSPLALPLIVLAPAMMLGKRWAARPAYGLAIALAASSFLGLLLKLLPWFHQVNWDMIALTLPGNLALVWAIHGLAKASPATATTAAPAGRSGADGGAPKARKARAKS